MHAWGSGGEHDVVTKSLLYHHERKCSVGAGRRGGKHLRHLLAGTQTAKLSVKSSIMALGFPCQCRAAH